MTKRTPEEISQGLLALANEVRRSLPRFTSRTSLVTDACVFVQRSAGQRASFDGTRDEVAYGKAMDKRGLPGITVDESKPITVTFDWHANRHVPDEVVERLYALLAPLCRAYKSALPRTKPFTLGGDYEAISGFKTVNEARDLANTLARASREFLIEQKLAA